MMLAWTINRSFIGDAVPSSPRDNPLSKIDFDAAQWNNDRVKAPKPNPARRQAKSLGENWAAEIRAKCYRLTRAQRERPLDRAMQLGSWR